MSARPLQMERWAVWKRMLRQRWSTGEGASRQRLRQTAGQWLAAAYAGRLRPAQVELVVQQDLLVPLHRCGVLGGRVYDVWLGELPAAVLEARLDAAAAVDDQVSLRDFRVDADWHADEWRALAQARSRVTAHADVARVLNEQGLPCILVPWCVTPPAQMPARAAAAHPLTLGFAASALARKGEAAVRHAARVLGARVLILGSPPADAGRWQGIDWEHAGYAGDWLSRVDAVVLPAYVEHQPRALLKALSAGVPVFASPACGLGTLPGWVEVQAGCGMDLVDALQQLAPGAARDRNSALAGN